MRLLVVEDDPLLAEGLMRTLARAGHAVEHASGGRHASTLLAGRNYDLVVLDIGLPDIDGFEVLRRLRQRRTTANVLVLTARDAVEDRVHGLDLGADDYLTKPFSLTEFEARVRALLRRGASVPTRLTVGALAIDVAAKRVRAHDHQIELTPREWALLEVFLSHPGRVLSKEQIAESLFSFDEILSANAIEVHVSRLRTKIEQGGFHIRTVRGFGYLWGGGDE